MKKIILCSLIGSLLIYGKGYAQFTHIWNTSFQHTVDPTFSNESRKMTQDGSGNVFVLADITSSGSMHGTTYHYITLLKYSAGGVLLNQMDVGISNHVISGFDNFSAFGLETDASGNVYIGYSMYSAANDFNIKISKYSNNLVRVWTNTFGAAGTETGIDMKVHSSGTVYALIKSTVSGTTTYKAIKTINADGNATAVYVFNPSSEVVKSIAVDASQNIYVAGSRVISGFKNILLISVNGNNNAIRFTSTYNGGVSGDDYANMVTIGIDGNIYVIGTSNQGGGHGSDQIVLKHLPTTTQFWVWTSLLQNSSSDEGLFITAPETNYLYTGMTTNKKVRIMRLNTSDGKISVSGAASNYEPLPASPYSSITGITFNDMKVSSNKNIYVTGSVLATNTSGQPFSACYLKRFNFIAAQGTYGVGFNDAVTGTFTNNYKGVALSLVNSSTSVLWLRDYWTTNATHASEEVQLYSMDVPSTLRENEPGTNSLSVFEHTVSFYPIPAKDVLYFSSSQAVLSVEIEDLTGKKVSELLPVDNWLDISMLQRGVYFAKATTLSGIQVKRIIVE